MDGYKNGITVYLDNLSIRDAYAMVAQGYYFLCNNGHVEAVLPEGRDLNEVERPAT